MVETLGAITPPGQWRTRPRQRSGNAPGEKCSLVADEHMQPIPTTSYPTAAARDLADGPQNGIWHHPPITAGDPWEDSCRRPRVARLVKQLEV